MKLSMKKDKNHMKKRTIWLLPLFTALLILCLACGGSDGEKQANNGRQNGGQAAPEISGTEDIAIVTPEPDPHRDELDAILKRVTMLEGVTINGVDVGGMTVEQAKAAVQPSLDAKRKDLKVEVTFGEHTETFSGETIPVDSDLDEALDLAFALVRDDLGYDSVSREVERIKSQGMDFPVRLSFDETALQNAVNAFADAHETEPKNASVSYNKEENEIDFTADVPGRKVNREALFSALLDAEGGETLEAP
ncbi:MAG: peptidoglycan binding domain-containing protein, partial [Clostridia bacterium]|nr:peptidoglycan binding domain-containing protein [Clostridia bacterium]